MCCHYSSPWMACSVKSVLCKSHREQDAADTWFKREGQRFRRARPARSDAIDGDTDRAVICHGAALRMITLSPTASSSPYPFETLMAQSATEQSFRTNLSQFRWARGNTDDSQAAASDASSNPFSRFYNAIGGGYIPLRSSERTNEEEAYFALSRWDRCELLVSSLLDS